MPYKILEGTHTELEKYLDDLETAYKYVEVVSFNTSDSDCATVLVFLNDNINIQFYLDEDDDNDED